ncbi:restriction endonuclease [Candidatus Poribacteria bacterium]|nr:MAG: restriction endonuclease [Candidatus Poribacteria bacterium]
METVTKMAWNPDTEEEYEIELPAKSLVENALLQLDYPPDGLDKDETSELLAQHFSLTDEQRNARYRSSNRVFNSYVGKVTSALVKSGKMVWLKDWKRGLNPEQGNEQTRVAEQDSDNSRNTSEKSIEENYQQIRKELAGDLLQQIKGNTPAFFEELVIDLLVVMGYGGSREDAQAVGRSGDGGIDGIINEDRLGLDVIYVQAKRWEGSVSEPPIRDFVGALQGRRARKGIFITTSGFSKSAREYISAIDSRDSKVILIDGNQLAELMIDHDVGVSIEKTYKIKRVDSDYFAENAD